MGLRNRFQLARALRRDGLPALEDLTAWARALYWLQEAERTGASLCELAQCAGVDPAFAYRLVHRTTSLRWAEARRVGLAAIARRFRDWCHTDGSTAYEPALELWRAPDQWERRAPASRVALGHALVPPGHPRGDLAGRLPLAGYPFDVVMAPNGDAWVTRAHAAALDGLGLTPPRVFGSVRTGPTPSRIAMLSSGERAYVTNQFPEEVAVIDLQQRRQVGTIPVPGNPLGAVLSLDDQTLYVTTNRDQLLAIRLPSGQITRSVSIPMACTSLLLHPSGTRLLVPTFKAGTILEVDARTLNTLRSHRVGGVVHELACTPDGLRLYATNEAGWLDAIQLTTGSLDSLHFGTMAHGLALSPDGVVLYVGLLRAGAVAIVDRQTLTIVATIPTGGKPRRIAFNAAGRGAIITNESGWVDLVM